MLRLESLDTNILMRLILQDVEDHYERALNLITSPRCIFYVPDQVILEVVFNLTRREFKMLRSEVITKLEQVLTYPRLDYDKEIFDKVFKAFLAHPKLSLTDCYLAVKIEKAERTPLWTFDEKLAKQMKGAELVEKLA